ncbi:MAG: ABC-F family ATP-binding cassette domain-containing protein, partial [Clostridiales bacterium]|nr:ABC-F family ATP-binding cassette domain-containing protein [Clostridiales bacterium]
YDTKSFHAAFTPKLETGKDVLFIQDLVIGYDKPVATVNLDLKKGERLAVIGDNGIGKSTLLKTLVGEVEKLSGDFRFGANVVIGYFDQRMAQYTSDKTVIDDYWDMYPTLTETEVRNRLGAFCFTQDEVYKDVSMLSGGERVRLCLAKIFHTLPNVLILDEPTNHMDMIGKETLEAMLVNFPGTVIFVSHDRYFVKKVSTQILEMRNDGVQLYPFGYEDYIEKRENIPADTRFVQTEKPQSVSSSQAERLAGKEEEKRQRRIRKLEDKIEELEAKIDELKEELCKPEYASMYSKLSEIQGEIDAAEAELLETMEAWENESNI